MRAFETNRLVFTWMGIFKPETNLQFFRKLSISFALLIIILASLATVSSATFVYKNLSIDLEQALSAVFQVSGLFSSIHIMTSALIY